MLSFLTRLAVRRASVTLLLMAAILLFGIFAATQLKQELTPSIDFPVISIITTYPGAEPQAVADTVSAPVEQAVSGQPGLQNVQSTSSNGLSIVLASFEYGTDLKAAQSTISNNLQAAALPAGAGTPRVQFFNFQSQPIVQLSLSSTTKTPAELAQLARAQVLPELKKVDGVFSVDLSGGGTRQLVIKLDPSRLAAQQVSVQQGSRRSRPTASPSPAALSTSRASPSQSSRRTTFSLSRISVPSSSAHLAAWVRPPLARPGSASQPRISLG